LELARLPLLAKGRLTAAHAGRLRCEARNVHLDRALLVDTVGPVGAAFF
jgi:hypothetical protein